MPTFDPQPTLTGDLVTLRPLTPADYDDLYAVAVDPLIWEQHPAPDRWQEPVFRAFFDAAIATEAAFATIDKSTGLIIGSTRYHALDDPSEIEIGWTFLARSHWGGRYNADAKRLMLDHAFRSFERVAFYVGADNVRSQRAVQRLGATLAERLTRADRHGNPLPYLKYTLARPTETPTP